MTKKQLALIAGFSGLLAIALLTGYLMRQTPTPDYQVISSNGNIQIRSYPPLLMAEVTVTGDRKTAANRGFRILASYIFGDNHTQPGSQQQIAMTAPVIQHTHQKIAMTAPVLETKEGENKWVIQFIMPAQFTRNTLPQPNDTRISIVEQPTQQVIAIRFNGRATPENLEKHRQKLEHYIKQNNIKICSTAQYAFYNPPWTLPVFRRNEIWYCMTSNSKP